mgnify:CR=1 FL=1
MEYLQIFLFLFLIFIAINKNKEPFADSGYYDNNNYYYLKQGSESNLVKGLDDEGSDDEGSDDKDSDDEDLEMNKSSLYEMYDKVDEYMFSGEIEKIVCYKDKYCESSFIYSSYSPSS